MRWDFLLVTVLFSMGTFLIVATVYIFTRKEKIAGIRLIGYMAALNCVFLYGYGGFLLADAIPLKIWLNHIQYLAIPFFSALWYLLSILQRKKQERLKPWFVVCVMVLPLLSCVTNFLYPAMVEPNGSWITHLFFTSHQVVTNLDFGSGFVGVIFTKGFFYYMQMSYNIILAIFTIRNYALAWKKSEPIARKRMLILMGTSTLIFALAIMSFLDRETAMIDTSPLVTGLFSFMTFLLLFQYELFELIPIAYRQIFQESEYPIVILDRTFGVVSINNNAKTFLHGRINKTINQSLRTFEEFDPGIYEDLTKKGIHEFTLADNGEPKYYSIKLITLFRRNRDITGYTLYYQDITAHKNELHRMEVFAEYDDLTKIHNRRFFFQKATEEFDRAIEERQRISIIMFDLDDFKQVNDIFGHQAGDMILQEMAAIFSKELGEEELFARYGGEEFIIFQRNKTIDEAAKVANRLCALLKAHVFIHEKRTIRATASFGVTGSKKQINQSLDRYIKEADDMLYKAKALGKKQIYVNSENN